MFGFFQSQHTYPGKQFQCAISTSQNKFQLKHSAILKQVLLALLARTLLPFGKADF